MGDEHRFVGDTYFLFTCAGVKFTLLEGRTRFCFSVGPFLVRLPVTLVGPLLCCAGVISVA